MFPQHGQWHILADKRRLFYLEDRVGGE